MAVGAMSGCGSKKTSTSTQYTKDGETLLHIITQSKDVDPEGYAKSIEKFGEFAEFYKTTYADKPNTKGNKGVAIEPSFFEFNTKDYAALALGVMMFLVLSVFAVLYFFLDKKIQENQL